MTDVQPTTSQTGTPIASDAHSLTAGPDGVTALHDRYLVEKLAQFNRERIPERIVHAKGGGAFGEFVVTEDVSRFTKAAVFQPGARTETLHRFSSVAGEMGSPDTWRDVRGFSVKFYTTEGNYDIVGNNTPVFFIRDAIRGLPRSWREMPGFGSHTYQWINAAGERFWVKYHFTSNQGNIEIEGSEAELIAGADADYYRRDLYEAIEAGNFPSWDVSVQVMPYEDGKTYRFNPFDVTKVWPHADYPLIKVGTHTLNRNPQNHFAEIEQAAFSPANLVPGIDASPDKMLMARIFSYPDAQRYRLGANYNQIPVNSPHAAPVNTYTQDGASRHAFNAPTTPVYAPNSLGGPVADPALAGEGGWESDGALVRAAATLRSEDSDFGQAGTLYREVFDDAAKARFLETITGAISGVTRDEVRERAIWYWTQVDATLGAALRLNLASGEQTANEAAEYVGVAE
jgi:catalase